MSNETTVSSVSVASPAPDVQTTVKINKPTKPSKIVPSVKQKSKIVWTDGCLVGRMSLLRSCVDKKKTDVQTLETVRKKYPHGLTGARAITWIRREMDKYRARLAKRNPAPAAKKTRKPRTAAAVTPAVPAPAAA